MHTRKRSIDQASETASVVEPQLLLLTPQSQASPSPVPSTPQPPSHKKQRTRRNAKTEEEKQARADERALRNRRAAQESRDRKKKQLDQLESDNERLRTQNESLRKRLELLELQVNGIAQELERDVKLEVEEIVPTHYPAAVMSLDQQCQTISSPPLRQTLQRRPTSTSTSTSTLSLPSKRLYSQMLNKPNLSKLQAMCPPLTTPHFLLRQWMISSLRISCPSACFDSCATFESLNTGSLDIGAGLKRNSFPGYEPVSDGYSVELVGVVFCLWVMEIIKVHQSCVSLGSMSIDGNNIPDQSLNFKIFILLRDFRRIVIVHSFSRITRSPRYVYYALAFL